MPTYSSLTYHELRQQLKDLQINKFSFPCGISQQVNLKISSKKLNQFGLYLLARIQTPIGKATVVGVTSYSSKDDFKLDMDEERPWVIYDIDEGLELYVSPLIGDFFSKRQLLSNEDNSRVSPHILKLFWPFFYQGTFETALKIIQENHFSKWQVSTRTGNKKILDITPKALRYFGLNCFDVVNTPKGKAIFFGVGEEGTPWFLLDCDNNRGISHWDDIKDIIRLKDKSILFVGHIQKRIFPPFAHLGLVRALLMSSYQIDHEQAKALGKENLKIWFLQGIQLLSFLSLEIFIYIACSLSEANAAPLSVYLMLNLFNQYCFKRHKDFYINALEGEASRLSFFPMSFFASTYQDQARKLLWQCEKSDCNELITTLNEIKKDDFYSNVVERHHKRLEILSRHVH